MPDKATARQAASGLTLQAAPPPVGGTLGVVTARVRGYDEAMWSVLRNRVVAPGPAAALGTLAAAVLLCGNLRQDMAGLACCADTGLPLPVSPESFLHLGATRALLEEGLRVEPGAVGVALAALCCRLTGTAPESLFLVLSLILPLLPGLSVLPWVRLLGLGPAGAGIAAFSLTLFPALASRMGPGVCEAAPLILTLWNLLLGATAHSALEPPPSGDGRIRVAPLLPLLYGAALWALWPPGIWPGLVCVGLWAVFARGDAPVRRTLRRALRLGFPLFGLWIALAPVHLLPSSAAAARAELVIRLHRLLAPGSELFFLSAADLAPLSAETWAIGFGGSPATGAAALLCAFLPVVLRPALFPFLLPCLLAAPAGAQMPQLLFAAALPVSLGIALLPSSLLADGLCPPDKAGHGADRRRGVPGRSLLRGLGVCLVLWLLRPLAAAQLRSEPFPEFHTTAADRVLVSLRETAGPQTRAFNWWDDGGLIRARTGIVPFADPARRTPLAAFIVSRGLCFSDPLTARRWIRFFALRGEHALEPFYALWGGRDAAFALLEKLFAGPDARVAAARLPFPRAYGPEWLFPSGRAVLYLPARFLLLNPWWMALGEELRPGPERVVPHLERFLRTTFDYNPETRELVLPPEVTARGYRSVGRVFLTHREPLQPPYGADAAPPLLITSFRSPWLYLTDAAVTRTLAFRLLAPGGEEPAGFRAAAFDPAAAGAWEVLP